MNINIMPNSKIDDYQLVSVKKMGNIIEICHCEKRKTTASIKLIDKNHYSNTKTGEVFECNHIESRANGKAQVAQSLKRLRDYLNTNITDVSKCKWITLTYAENMMDTNRLYNDFKKFIMRFKYKFKTFKFEYIVAMEPQSRGAWHCHCVFIFNSKAPFIPNETIEKLWSHGFTKTTKLDNIDNIGAYLTAYLADIEYNAEQHGKEENYKIKNIIEIDEQNNKKEKRYIKGGRLYLYPPKFNLYRISRGIKKPKKVYMQYSVAKEKVGLRTPTYSKSIQLTSTDNLYTNQITYEYYNIKRQ